ncbi:MAG TPA: FAD-binding protein, partial [Candidatus Acetothermia bacterium]|nr:FAD-binding protein [Candidatus Acetothermia bacterium]
MRLRLHQISVDLDYEMADVVTAVVQRLACRAEDLGPIELRRRSIDARPRRAAPCFVLSVEVDYRGNTPPQTAVGWVEPVEPKTDEPARSRGMSLRSFRPVIVGAGPAGLLAALTLAEAGARPRLIERGDPVDERRNRVEKFWKEGVLDAESNVLYGEGGAGLFSDGKLTARSKERGAVREFLEILVACGASQEILIDAEPHLGTDALVEIIPALRQRILSLGGEIAHRTCLESIHQEDGRLRGVVLGGQQMETEACLLATGHSARDVYRMLAESRVPLEAKPFAMGVRVEMPQSSIDRAQFGRWAGHPRLGPASFRLTRNGEGNARDCYSFCMCPGGVVMACASSPGEITTNG